METPEPASDKWNLTPADSEKPKPDRRAHVTADEVQNFHEAQPRQGWVRPPLARLRYQVPLAWVVVAAMPALPFLGRNLVAFESSTSLSNTFVAVSVCALWALLLFRRLGSFPGITSFGQVLPSVGIPYLSFLVGFFYLRLDYSRPFLAISAAMAVGFFALLWIYYRRGCAPTVYILPGTNLSSDARIKCRMVDRPDIRFQPNSIVAADLRADYPPVWEKFLLRAALTGIPVYHAKVLEEAITGKVEVEHLSENTFGSVIPSNAYIKVKRVLDLGAASLLLLLAALPAVAIAIAIALDSPGGVFFRQERMGFRGKKFRVIKFRTMRASLDFQPSCARTQSITTDDDERITRVGRFIRRTRMDELPQLINILRGEMSLIGPRPEAGPLSVWYHDRIPFYAYRHVVRPGITGWAQVNQGHVTDVNDVRQKLHYDFYYIKYFSAWLDALIVLRTIKIIVGGFGAR